VFRIWDFGFIYLIAYLQGNKMENKYKLLKEKLGEIADINSANNLLQWDQQTYMPKGGASARAESISVLSRIAHEKFTAQETGRLINESRSWAENKGFDSDEAALLRVVVRDYEKAVKIPADFVAELSKEVSVAMEAWQNAKAKSDFSLFKDHLKKIVELNKRKAEILGYKESLYDALLDEFEPDMTYRARPSERLLPIALALAGFCMTGLSIILLLNAAKLGVFMRMMLGFIGVIFVDSVILTLVAVRIAVSREDHATMGEKVVLLGLSLCTGIGLMIT